MSSDSTDERGVPHNAFVVLIIFPPFPNEIAVLCHHAKAKEIFLRGGLVGLSPFTKMNKVGIFLLETSFIRIGFTLPFDLFSTMYRYWEQTVTENYFEIKYSLYVADVNLVTSSIVSEILVVLKRL
jgi:hypothetical protein